MVTRIAAVLALLAFAVCLVVGMEADNSFATTVERALTAMMAMLVIGLVLGAMARRMLEENISVEEEKLKKKSASAPQSDR